MVRSRSRILSLLPVRTPDPFSIDSKVVRTDLDVTMSDDDVDSDISVDSEHEVIGTSPHTWPKSIKVFELEKATFDDIKKCLPSHENIKFLLRSLKHNFEGQCGCFSWNIDPSVAWSAKCRDAFFQAMQKLGFTFRAGGGNVLYIQILKTRGSRLLSLLNSTLATFNGGVRHMPIDAESNETADELAFSLTKNDFQTAKSSRLTPQP